MTARAALKRLGDTPRRELGVHPTPLLDAGNLRAEIGPGCPQILLKMDAWNGFGFGGNKVRKLEFFLAEPVLGGTDCLLTCGGVQSNHARVTAAAAAHLGFRCVLVLSGQSRWSPGETPSSTVSWGRRFGAFPMARLERRPSWRRPVRWRPKEAVPW